MFTTYKTNEELMSKIYKGLQICKKRARQKEMSKAVTSKATKRTRNRK